MLLIGDGETIKIFNRDIQEFGDDLLKFVNVYKNYVYIEKQKDIEILSLLEHIGHLIKQKRYSELFDNNIEVVYDEPILIDIPF